MPDQPVYFPRPDEDSRQRPTYFPAPGTGFVSRLQQLQDEEEEEEMTSTSRMENEESQLAGVMYSTLHTADTPRREIVKALLGKKAKVDIGSGMEQYLTSEYLFNVIDEARHDDKGNPVLQWLGSTPELHAGISVTAGFIGDVLLDPVTYAYTPLASMTKKVMATSAGKALSRVASNATTAVKETAPGQAVWKMFSTKYGLSGHEGFARKEEDFRNVYNAINSKEVIKGKGIQQAVQRIADDTGVPFDDVKSFITEGAERGSIANIGMDDLPEASRRMLAGNPHVRQQIINWSDENATQLAESLAAGVKLKQFREVDNEGLLIDYAYHAITPEAKQAAVKKAKRTGSKGGRSYSVRHASMLARNDDFRNMTIHEINTQARKGTLKGYEGTRFPDGFFYDDPGIVRALRGARHQKSVNTANFLRETAESFGKSTVAIKDMARANGAARNITKDEALDYLKSRGLIEDDMVYATNDLVRGHAFPAEIARRVDEYYNVMFNPEKLNWFIQQSDELTNWWRAYTLSIFPSYHARNAAGNMWNNFTQGVIPGAGHYKKAYLIQNGKDGTLRVPGGTNIPYSEIRDDILNLGVHNKGMMSFDIESDMLEEFGLNKWLSLSSKSKAIHYGRKTGEFIDNNARIANYVDGLQRGLSKREAAMRTKATLFDYSDLTGFEKGVMKRIMPFYTWSRKNIPFQFEQMMKNPGKYKAIDTFRQTIEARSETPDEKILGHWFLDNYAMRTGVDAKGNPTYFLFGGWWPAADIWKLVAAPVSKHTGSLPVPQLALDLLHPIPKVMLETMMKQSLFTGKELDGSLEDFLGVRMDSRIKNALGNIRFLVEADNFIQAIDASFPEMTKGTTFERVDPKMEPVTEKTMAKQLINFFSGLREYSVNFERQRMFNMFKKSKELREGKKAVQRQIFKGYRSRDELSSVYENITGKQLGGRETETEMQDGVIDHIVNFFIGKAGAATLPQGTTQLAATAPSNIQKAYSDAKPEFKPFISKLYEEAEAAGISFSVMQGVRPAQKQLEYFEEPTKWKTSAIPGESDHQYGLGIDIKITADSNDPKFNANAAYDRPDRSKTWKKLRKIADGLGFQKEIPGDAGHFGITGWKAYKAKGYTPTGLTKAETNRYNFYKGVKDILGGGGKQTTAAFKAVRPYIENTFMGSNTDAKTGAAIIKTRLSLGNLSSAPNLWATVKTKKATAKSVEAALLKDKAAAVAAGNTKKANSIQQALDLL